MMGGEIVVESKEGVGSSFTVTLIIERTRKKEIGKPLIEVNILMFGTKKSFHSVGKILKLGGRLY